LSAREQRGAGNADEGLPLDPTRVWLMFRRTWQIVAVAGVVGAFAGAAVAKKVVKQTFTARAVLSWDTGAPTDWVQRRTLLETATLGTNLEQVARRMHLTPDPVALRSAFIISSSEQSNTIGVEGIWTDAQGAANLTNALVDVLLESRRKQLDVPARAGVERAREDLEDAESKLAEAAAAYAAFRLEPSVSRLSSEREAAIQQAAELAAPEPDAAAVLPAQATRLSTLETRAVALLVAQRLAEQRLTAAQANLAAAELQRENLATEFRVIERAKPPRYAAPSARKQVAVIFPVASVILAAIGLFLWSLRRLKVVTPVEAAFWSKLPVIGASTWPRDPEMLATLMRDLDDYAPRAEGVILIVGASTVEADLARDVAEWSGYTGQPFGAVDERNLVDARGDVDGAYLTIREPGASSPSPREAPSMQILTLNGPVPAQALRRAARLADRVLVVVTSGKHDIFQLRKIRERLGRDEGIGILWVGLDKDFAMVRDRVGAVDRFWYAKRDPLAG